MCVAEQIGWMDWLPSYFFLSLQCFPSRITRIKSQIRLSCGWAISFSWKMVRFCILTYAHSIILWSDLCWNLSGEVVTAPVQLVWFTCWTTLYGMSSNMMKAMPGVHFLPSPSAFGTSRANLHIAMSQMMMKYWLNGAVGSCSWKLSFKKIFRIDPAIGVSLAAFVRHQYPQVCCGGPTKQSPDSLRASATIGGSLGGIAQSGYVGNSGQKWLWADMKVKKQDFVHKRRGFESFRHEIHSFLVIKYYWCR